jgi:hypothetical protein
MTVPHSAQSFSLLKMTHYRGFLVLPHWQEPSAVNDSLSRRDTDAVGRDEVDSRGGATVVAAKAEIEAAIRLGSVPNGINHELVKQKEGYTTFSVFIRRCRRFGQDPNHQDRYS